MKLLLSCFGGVDRLNGEGDAALFLAVQEGHIDVVDLLIREGADVNLRGGNRSTPLHVAAAHGSGELVALLLKYGAKLDLNDASGLTAVELAVRSGDVGMIGLFKEHGARITVDSTPHSSESATAPSPRISRQSPRNDHSAVPKLQ